MDSACSPQISLLDSPSTPLSTGPVWRHWYLGQARHQNLSEMINWRTTKMRLCVLTPWSAIKQLPLALYIRPSKAQHLVSLRNTLSKMDPTRPYLLVGDLNARSLVWEHSTQAAGTDISWQMGQLLEETCIDFDFNILNNRRFTYV